MDDTAAKSGAVVVSGTVVVLDKAACSQANNFDYDIADNVIVRFHRIYRCVYISSKIYLLSSRINIILLVMLGQFVIIPYL